MSDRSQAIAILKEAREVLLKRLSESVIEAELDILDDAHGQSYCGQIEALHDQIGSRLGNVNAMLAQLQTAEAEAQLLGHQSEAEDAAPIDFFDRDDEPVAAASSVAHEPNGNVSVAAAHNVEILGPQPAMFETFLEAIKEADLGRASRCLAELFAIDERRAWSCAVTFREQWERSPDFLDRAKALRFELQNSVNGSLMLLWECFGLAVPESILVLQTLKTRLGYR